MWILLALLLVGCARGQDISELACGPDRPAVVDASTPGLVAPEGYSLNTTYEPNMLCEWNIKDEDNTGMELFFLDFDVEPCNVCRCDSLVIWLGDDDSGELLANLCGTENPDPIAIDPGQSIFIRFTSDDLVFTFRGFLIRYGFPLTSTACTVDRPDEITQSQGSFLTPNYPADYENNLICQWRFIAPEGQRVRLTFLDWEVEGSCFLYDVMQVFDGDSLLSPRLGRWYAGGGSSEPTLPPIIESSGNVLYVQFTTDSSVVYRGFWGVFEHVN